ncbi:MAG: efflux RND transporter periplasmic adaptor subunit [Silvibacterium sp.]|nr:efflux RND transporter periplasmic adaptor subunit [Silvibacterium sp.]
MANIKGKNRNAVWIWAIAAVALVGVFYLVRIATRTRVPVRIAAAERGELRSTISTNGRVEPQVNFEAHAPYSGLIKDRYAHEGERVTQGELLVELDGTDARTRLAEALANLRNTQATYNSMVKGGTQEERLALNGDIVRMKSEHEQAEQNLNALKKLQLTGAASASEVAAAEQRLAATNVSMELLQQRKTKRYDAGDLERAKTAFEQAQAAYAAAQSVLSQADVRAPFSGTVYSLPVSKSEYVQQGALLLQMADLSKLQVRGYFDEPEIGKLHVGQPITIEWDARPGKEWHGHIARVPSTIITYGTRNVGEVLITIDDAQGDLLPNTNVRITVIVANEGDALNVPREALHTDRGKSYVFRIVNGKLRSTEVRVGSLNLTQVEILSGLKEGDEVALGSTNGVPLVNGMPVIEGR